MYGYIANLNEKFGNKRTTIYVKSVASYHILSYLNIIS